MSYNVITYHVEIHSELCYCKVESVAEPLKFDYSMKKALPKGSAFFVRKRTTMQFFEDKDVSINCPNCGKLLTKADSRDETIHKSQCRRCGKWIWYKPSDTSYYRIKDVPERKSSSGVTFY